MASIRTSMMSSTRKSVRKHGLGVMEYQMEGMVASLLALLFVIRDILRFSGFETFVHKLLEACR